MSVLDRIAREYVDLVLTKHQYHDVWDVYWLADTIFWKREDMHVDRVNRRYPYKPAPAKSYQPGDVVMHKVFGRGVVTRVTPAAGDFIVEIRFDKVGVKKTMANYAPLTKVSEG